MSGPDDFPNIALMTVADLIGAIGGAGMAPGAGAAGAVTLALAAACTAKAVAISMKHQPDLEVLRRSQAALERIGRFALAGADRDAETFAAFLKEHSIGSIEQVIREGDKIGHLIEILAWVTDQVTPHIEPNMAGDLVAARALIDGARQIQRANSSEAQEQRTRMDSAP